MIGLLLAAMLTIIPPSPSPSPAPHQAITIQTPTDSFDALLVVHRKDHFKVVTAGEFQKALPKCKAFNVSMFDEEDGGVLVVFNCFL